MKKILFSIAFLCSLGIKASAQTPQAFNYQGVARNSLGLPMASATLGLRLSVHDGSSTGPVVYQETQAPVTNTFGLYNVAIGTGTAVTGTLSAVNWATGTKFLQVEIDPAGGAAYIDAGTSQLLSVPYAQYAERSNTANSAGTATTATTAGSITGTVPMGGDVTGTNAAATVVKLNGNAVSATAPTAGQVLAWNTGSGSWAPFSLPASGSVSSITAGAGLAGGVITSSGTISMPNVGTPGTYGTATTVPMITTDAQGRVTAITNTPITGDNWGTQTAQTDATLTGNGTPGSKLSIARQGATVGQALEWNGTSWQPNTIATPVTYSAGTGLSLAGTVFSAQNTTALWNASDLQGRNVSTTAPVSGQVLSWSGTNWAPTSVTGTGTVTSVTAGTGLLGGTFTSSGTISMPGVGTAGTYGSATQVPVFTTDAQGRVTGVTNTTIAGGSAYTAGAGLNLTGTTFSMPNVGTAATYGTATQVPVFTTDAQGRVSGVTNTTITGTTPGGAAGGDLSGTYPNPAVAAGAITNAKVAAAAGIAYSKLNLTGGITVADHSATGTASATSFLRGDNTWATPTGIVPGGAAGGDLSGTYPNPAVATGAITNAKVATGAAIAYSKLNLTGSITVADHSATGTASATSFLRGDNTWATPTGIVPGGAAGGDLSGTYPNPALAASGVTAGTYGSATSVPTITVDAKGRITSAANTTITTGVAGTLNYVPKFTSATAIGNSQMFDNGTSVGLGTTTPAATNKLQVLNASLAASQNAVHGIAGAVAASSFTSAVALYGESSTGNGVAGVSTSGVGVLGLSTTSGSAGIYGSNTASGGLGIWGAVSGTAGSTAGYFDGGISGGYAIVVPQGISGFGATAPSAMVHVSGSKDLSATIGGLTFGHQAFIAQTGTTTTAQTANAIIGFSGNSSLENHGLLAYAYGTGGAAYNVGAFCIGSSSVVTTGNSYGVYGSANNGANNYGVYGAATGTGYAGYFSGALYATSASSSIKSFKIDDPRDPANKYLMHSSVESDEMMDLYKGHITTDANGDATVTMPSYFTMLNKEYDYQLTCIGQFAQAIVYEEISGNQFKIKTDKPNVKVSWQVAGVRQDPAANAYRVQVESEKPASEKGTYLQPELYGKGKDKAQGYLDPSAGAHAATDGKQTPSNTQAPVNVAARPATAGIETK